MQVFGWGASILMFIATKKGSNACHIEQLKPTWQCFTYTYIPGSVRTTLPNTISATKRIWKDWISSTNYISHNRGMKVSQKRYVAVFPRKSSGACVVRNSWSSVIKISINETIKIVVKGKKSLLFLERFIWSVAKNVYKWWRRADRVCIAVSCFFAIINFVYFIKWSFRSFQFLRKLKTLAHRSVIEKLKSYFHSSYRR